MGKKVNTVRWWDPFFVTQFPSSPTFYTPSDIKMINRHLWPPRRPWSPLTRPISPRWPRLISDSSARTKTTIIITTPTTTSPTSTRRLRCRRPRPLYPKSSWKRRKRRNTGSWSPRTPKWASCSPLKPSYNLSPILSWVRLPTRSGTASPCSWGSSSCSSRPSVSVYKRVTVQLKFTHVAISYSRENGEKCNLFIILTLGTRNL